MVHPLEVFSQCLFFSIEVKGHRACAVWRLNGVNLRLDVGAGPGSTLIGQAAGKAGPYHACVPGGS